MNTAPKELTTDDRLDLILLHLERMDRRDRLRTIGGFFKTLITFIPIIILVWSTWYFVAHMDEIMKKFAEQVTNQTKEMIMGQ